MRINPVKRKLLAGEVSLGTFVFEFQTEGISRIAGVAGAEFVVYDLEHTGSTLETVRLLTATTQADGPVPIVRLPVVEYNWIARTLDAGAMGLMFPMVESAEQAKRIVESAKYPPLGRRGAAFGIAHDGYDGGDIHSSMNSANEETLLIAQIETRAGLESVEQIAAVDGIDCLWIGHFDLTNSLGIPGQFDHVDFVAAVRRVLKTCADSGKIPGFMASDIANGKQLLEQGFRAIAYGGDLWLYQQALADGLCELRSTL